MQSFFGDERSPSTEVGKAPKFEVERGSSSYRACVIETRHSRPKGGMDIEQLSRNPQLRHHAPTPLLADILPGRLQRVFDHTPRSIQASTTHVARTSEGEGPEHP